MPKNDHTANSIERHKDKKQILLHFVPDNPDTYQVFRELKRRIELGQKLQAVTLPEPGDVSGWIGLYIL